MTAETRQVEKTSLGPCLPETAITTATLGGVPGGAWDVRGSSPGLHRATCTPDFTASNQQRLTECTLCASGASTRTWSDSGHSEDRATMDADPAWGL